MSTHTQNSASLKCPICELEAAFQINTGEKISTFYEVECIGCGYFYVDRYVYDYFAFYGDKKNITKQVRALVSHFIRKNCQLPEPTKNENRIDYVKRHCLTGEKVKEIEKNETLPKPPEQLNNLILSIGKETETSEDKKPFHLRTLTAIIGSINSNTTLKLLNYAKELKLISYQNSQVSETIEAELTMPGWQRYGELTQNTADNKNVFMAMQFGDKDIDQFYEDHLKPLINKMGFTLNKLEAIAGDTIDNQIRVAIRDARFIIADISRGNKGAYFEAGYAEGLGKTVIYTCDKKTFEEKDDRHIKPHFDINHMPIYVWDLDDINGKTKTELNGIKASIRYHFRDAKDPDQDKN